MAERSTGAASAASGGKAATLVFGARGSLAERVAGTLLARGERVRLALDAASLDVPRRALRTLAEKGAEVVAAELGSAAGRSAVLRDVRRVVFAATSAVRQGANSIEALQPVAAASLASVLVRAEVEQVVFLSEGALGSGTSLQAGLEAEARLTESGLATTLVKPLPVVARQSEAQRFGEEGRRVAFLPLAPLAELAARAALSPPTARQTLLVRAETFLYDELLWAVEEVVRISGESRDLLHAGLLGLLGRPRPLPDEFLAALVLGSELKLVSASVARALGLTPLSAETVLETALEPSS